MDTSRVLSLLTKPLLFLLEYIFKLSAAIATIIVLGAKGSFFVKLGTGFGSLLSVYDQLLEWPDKMTYLGTVIHDYNTLTASAFNQRYGGQALNRTMESLNEGVLYIQAVYENLAEQPIATVIAALIAFLVLYLLGRIFRFVRQRGEGSYLIRKERELGNRIFNKDTTSKSDYS